MATKFMVNGEEKELSLIDYKTNTDWSGDFVGNNAPDYMHTDDEGRWIVSEDEYQWWAATVAKWSQMSDLIGDYKERFEPDEVEQVVNDWDGGDLEDVPGLVTEALERVFGKI